MPIKVAKQTLEEAWKAAKDATRAQCEMVGITNRVTAENTKLSKALGEEKERSERYSKLLQDKKDDLKDMQNRLDTWRSDYSEDRQRLVAERDARIPFPSVCVFVALALVCGIGLGGQVL